MQKRILISNDDGFDARGIQVLERALQPLGDVFVVAPDSEQSASSHSLTIRRTIATTASWGRRPTAWCWRCR
jgi:5'-nucleotidase